MFALYSGSVADPGDRNPYAPEWMVLAKLWQHGYERMLRVRTETEQSSPRGRAAPDPDLD